MLMLFISQTKLVILNPRIKSSYLYSGYEYFQYRPLLVYLFLTIVCEIEKFLCF